jgi:hypothetical protein
MRRRVGDGSGPPVPAELALEWSRAMAASDRPTIVGVFTNHTDARRAVNDLRQANFREDQIGVISRGGEGIPPAEVPSADAATNSKIIEGAAIGAAAGAGIGAVWALGIAAGVLPVVGPIIAGGLLTSVLASAGGTAVVGGVLGALIGLGIPEDEARYYESEFAGGRTLVTVKPGGRFAEADQIIRNNGAYDIESGADRARSGGLSDRIR